MPKQLKLLWLLIILGAITGIAGKPLSHFLDNSVGGGFNYFVIVLFVLCVAFFVVALGLSLYYVTQKLINERQFAVFFVATFILGGMILFWIGFVLF